MDTTVSLLLLIALGIFVILISLFVRKTIKEAQKKKQEEQKRIAEEQRITELKGGGLNIDTTVRYADEYTLRTEGRHPDTGTPLFFIGVREHGQKQYSPGDPVSVLVDLKNPNNYLIRWEGEPEPSVLADKDDAPLLLADMPEMMQNSWLLDPDVQISKKGKRRSPKPKKQKCPYCKGEKTITTRCAECNGKRHKKEVEIIQGRKHVTKQSCPACFGSGKSFLDCPFCDGKGYTLSF